MQLSGVRPSSVRLSAQPPHAAAASLLLWARRPVDIDQLLRGQCADGRQQPRRSTARCSKCQLCLVIS